MNVFKKIKSYRNFKKIFPSEIADIRFKEKIYSRLVNYPLFHSKVCNFYNHKHEEVTNFLKKEFSNVIENYSYNGKEINTCNNEKKRMFTLWLQGYEDAPVVVKATIRSQQKYASTYGYEHILLDERNLYEYIELPKIIIDRYNKGIINRIKYSDIIRTVLLSKYGGIWLDATIYIDSSRKLEYLDDEFYTIRAKGDENFPKYVTNGRWGLFCLAGSKNNIVFDFLKRFQIEYFTKYDIAIDYFLIDYIMELGYRNNRDIKKHIDNVIENNQELYFLVNNFTKEYSANQWKNILENTSIFKCSYKVDLTTKKGSYLEKLLNEELSKR